MSKETFWLYNPILLFDKNVYPTYEMTYIEKLNSICRLIILLTIVGYLLTESTRFIITGVITLFCIIILYFVNVNKHEGYTELPDEESKIYTMPTEKNPLMNVSLLDYTENPKREKAAPYNDNINEEITEKTKDFIVNHTFKNENVKDKLFKEIGDSYNFDQSMRNWVVNPNTSIPNDQTAFLKYCYGDMKSCKEEAATCIKGASYSSNRDEDVSFKTLEGYNKEEEKQLTEKLDSLNEELKNVNISLENVKKTDEEYIKLNNEKTDLENRLDNVKYELSQLNTSILIK